MKLLNDAIPKVLEEKLTKFPMIVEDLNEDKTYVYNNYVNKTKPIMGQFNKIDILDYEAIRNQRVILEFIDGFYTEHYVVVTEYDSLLNVPDYLMFADKIEKEGIITYSFSSKVFGV
jgi:hypothetical protein